MALLIDETGSLDVEIADDRGLAGAASTADHGPASTSSTVAADGQRLNQGFLGMDAARSPKRMIGIVIAAFAGVLILVGVVGAFIFNAAMNGFGGG